MNYLCYVVLLVLVATYELDVSNQRCHVHVPIIVTFVEVDECFPFMILKKTKEKKRRILLKK
jgi:hypothetical protein